MGQHWEVIAMKVLPDGSKKWGFGTHKCGKNPTIKVYEMKSMGYWAEVKCECGSFIVGVSQDYDRALSIAESRWNCYMTTPEDYKQWVEEMGEPDVRLLS